MPDIASQLPDFHFGSVAIRNQHDKLEKGKKKKKINAPSVNKSSARGPVKLELTRAVGDRSAVQGQSLGSSISGRKLDEAVSGISEAVSSQFVVSMQLTLVTYPEFLSRITFTLTVSPAEERKTPLMKFSSIQGSSSPILKICKITNLQAARNAYQRVVLGESGPPAGGGTTERSAAGGVPLGKDISEYVLTS
jgi:hypothetical protein